MLMTAQTLAGFFPGQATIVMQSFALVDVAEEEIANAKRLRPDRSRELDATFMKLCPPKAMLGKTGQLYRSHVRELLHRVLNGRSLEKREATRAEVLTAMLDASLSAPPNSRACALIDELFFKVFHHHVNGQPVKEPWQNSNAELFAELSRKCVSAIP